MDQTWAGWVETEARMMVLLAVDLSLLAHAVCGNPLQPGAEKRAAIVGHYRHHGVLTLN